MTTNIQKHAVAAYLVSATADHGSEMISDGFYAQNAHVVRNMVDEVNGISREVFKTRV